MALPPPLHIGHHHKVKMSNPARRGLSCVVKLSAQANISLSVQIVGSAHHPGLGVSISTFAVNSRHIYRPRQTSPKVKALG